MSSAADTIGCGAERAGVATVEIAEEDALFGSVVPGVGSSSCRLLSRAAAIRSGTPVPASVAVITDWGSPWAATLRRELAAMTSPDFSGGLRKEIETSVPTVR